MQSCLRSMVSVLIFPHPGSKREVDALPAGDLIYLDVLGQPMVVLGSYKVARELLDKRSANYSDRPRSIMAQLYVDRPLV